MIIKLYNRDSGVTRNYFRGGLTLWESYGGGGYTYCGSGGEAPGRWSDFHILTSNFLIKLGQFQIEFLNVLDISGYFRFINRVHCQ